jgi:hypothetical protein
MENQIFIRLENRGESCILNTIFAQKFDDSSFVKFSFKNIGIPLLNLQLLIWCPLLYTNRAKTHDWE